MGIREFKKTIWILSPYTLVVIFVQRAVVKMLKLQKFKYSNLTLIMFESFTSNSSKLE